MLPNIERIEIKKADNGFIVTYSKIDTEDWWQVVRTNVFLTHEEAINEIGHSLKESVIEVHQ